MHIGSIVTGPPYQAFSPSDPSSGSSHVLRVYSGVGPPALGLQPTWSTLRVYSVTGPPASGLQSSWSTLRASARLVRPRGAYSLSGPLAGPSEQPVRPGYLGLQHKAGPASTQLQSKQPCAHIHTII